MQRLLLAGAALAFPFLAPVGDSDAVAQTRRPAAKPAAAAARPAAPPKYGALAVDRGKAYVYAWAYDHPTRAAANAFAQMECLKLGGKCKVVVEFSGPGCAAYQTVSASDGTAYGWGTAPTQAAAQSRALTECSKFANGKAVCSNSVWSCNSGPGVYKALYVEPVVRAPAPTDCLVQFEAEGYRGSDWVTRFVSPVYRLAASDCPLSGKSMHHGYGYYEHPGEKPGVYEVNEDRKGVAKQQRGYDWAKSFFQWSRRPFPFSGLRIHTSAKMQVSDATAENVDYLSMLVAYNDPGDKARISEGWCIDYAPEGVTPVATLGADKCRKWWR